MTIVTRSSLFCILFLCQIATFTDQVYHFISSAVAAVAVFLDFVNSHCDVVCENIDYIPDEEQMPSLWGKR